MRVLVTNPEVDSLTRYLLVWTERLLSSHKNRHEFIRLKADQVVRKRVIGVLSKKNIDAILFNGHGSSKQVQGQNGAIFGVDDVAFLRGKIVHALSCNTAKTLGPLARQSGVKEYVGYDESYVVLLQRDKIDHPELDGTAALFLDPAFIAPAALLNGKSGGEAVTLAKRAYNRSILKALDSDIQSDDDQFIGWLLWDRDHLVAC